ncbi:MAG: type I methionyl aminopeptidase [Eubacteriales bacterium]
MELISIKSKDEIVAMRKAGKIAAEARALAGAMIAPGVSTKTIDTEVRKFIKSKGAIPSFLNYHGFPASVCLSVNREVIHGIPDKRKLEEGDIVSVDVGAYIDGFHGDCAATYPVGNISEEAKALIAVTRQSFFEGMKFAREGCRVGDISHAIGTYAESFGYGVVESYVGHGLGRQLHEPPEVKNYGPAGRGPRLSAGMTLAVEPMINQGTKAVNVLADGWTVVTADGLLSAHYENSILITQDEVEILTITQEGLP